MHNETYPSWDLELKEKKEKARDTFAFFFKRPEGFMFKAGQNIRLFFDDLPEGSRRRTFTIASAPHEEDIMIVMRMRGSEWKKKIASLSLGEFIRAEGPTGAHFALHEDQNISAVFIAGGVGIAPFVSIFSDIARRELGYTITLFYSNKTKEDAPFLDSLVKYAVENKNLHMVCTLTRSSVSEDEGPPLIWELGRINAAMLRKHIPDITIPLYYVVGTPMMVSDMRAVILGIGVPDTRIMTKEFKGY